MSGILAILDRGALVAASDGPEHRPSDQRRKGQALAQRLTGLMAYRAPDGTGVWHDNALDLGHALFRTHTHGEQQAPGVEHDSEAGLHVVADARIDDREALVGALRGVGIRVMGREPALDTPAPQLILAAWKAWGPKCPERLLGAFAFVIWDARRRTLFAARDAFGVKPLFIAEVGGDPGRVIISNTLPVFLEHPDVSWHPDDRSVADHLLWGGIQSERRTYFQEIQQVERGSSVEVSPEGLARRKWWHLPEPAILTTRRRADVLDQFDALLHSAVHDRLPDGAHGAVIELSGGLDSAAIACAAVEVRGGPEALSAYTVGFERLIPDEEPPLARVTAGALGLRHELSLGDDWVEPIAGLPERMPDCAVPQARWPMGPGFDGAEESTPQMAGLGRVWLTGWDGDAVLYADTPAVLGNALREGGLAESVRLTGRLARFAYDVRRAPRARLRGALLGLLSSDEDDPFAGYPHGWIQPEVEARFELKERWARYRQRPASQNPRHRARSTLESAVWSRLFTEQDPGFTGQLVEARHPLLDRRLVEFFLSLPVVPWCVEKGVLRLWLRGRVPPAIWRRPKRGLQGDPLLATLSGCVASASSRELLVAELDRVAQDPRISGRLLRTNWTAQFLDALESDNEDVWPIHRGAYAHAVARWLRRIDVHDGAELG